MRRPQRHPGGTGPCDLRYRRCAQPRLGYIVWKVFSSEACSAEAGGPAPRLVSTFEGLKPEDEQYSCHWWKGRHPGANSSCR